MPIKPAGTHSLQSSVTSSTVAADRTIKLNPRKSLTANLVLVSGSPSTGARLQFTLSPHEDIDAGTANWINSPLGYTTLSRAESSPSNECNLTGIRADVSDGTWNMRVRQG